MVSQFIGGVRFSFHRNAMPSVRPLIWTVFPTLFLFLARARTSSRWNVVCSTLGTRATQPIQMACKTNKRATPAYVTYSPKQAQAHSLVRISVNAMRFSGNQFAALTFVFLCALDWFYFLFSWSCECARVSECVWGVRQPKCQPSLDIAQVFYTPFGFTFIAFARSFLIPPSLSRAVSPCATLSTSTADRLFTQLKPNQ